MLADNLPFSNMATFLGQKASFSHLDQSGAGSRHYFFESIDRQQPSYYTSYLMMNLLPLVYRKYNFDFQIKPKQEAIMSSLMSNKNVIGILHSQNNDSSL
jgi:hypothetical protein